MICDEIPGAGSKKTRHSPYVSRPSEFPRLSRYFGSEMHEQTAELRIQFYNNSICLNALQSWQAPETPPNV